MTSKWTRLALWAAAAAVPAGTVHPARAAGPSTELGLRYIDKINGYSLRGPAGAARQRGYSTSRLVTWTRRDRSTGAVDLTLAVLQREETKKKIDLKVYAASLTRRLAREQQLYVNKIRFTTVAGKSAIDLSGTGGLTGLGLWQRQAWILRKDGQFLILAISGPKARMANLNTVFGKVLATLELTDPAQAIKIRNANLKRGQDLLAGLTDTKLAAAFDGQKRWYLFSKDGKDVGYMYLRASPARREGADGYEIVSILRIKLPKGRLRRAKRELFATTKRVFSRWNETMIVGGAVSYREDGIKQGDLAVCHISSGGQERTFKKRLNGPTQKIFLPRALGMVLPRLIDLKKKQVYAFAAYASQANDFDVRTFTVVGGETITIGARRVEAVRVTDRAAADAEPATVWVDARGAILKMATPDGLVMVVSTQAAIIRRFGDDEMRIRTIR